MGRKQKKQWGVLWLAGWTTLLIIASGLLVGLFYNYRAIRQGEQQLAAVQAKLELQQQQNDELSRVLESGSDLEIIERVARDKLGYAKPNERVFVDVTGQ